MNNFLTTNFGPTLITKDFFIIELTFKNFIKNYKEIIKINIIKKTIKIKKKKIQNNKKDLNYKNINKLINFNNLKIKNYWKWDQIVFCSQNWDFEDETKYKKYKIKSLVFNHYKNVLEIEYDLKDVLLLSHLLYIKLNHLKDEDLKFKYIKCGESFIYSINILKFFNELSKQRKVFIYFNFNTIKITSYITYPMNINDKNAFSIVKQSY